MEICRLLRIKHYIKNLLIFFPMIFSGNSMNFFVLYHNIIGFITFSFSASIIYIFNDICDMEKDKQHPTKKNRPLASEKITLAQARFIIIVLSVIVIFLTYNFNKNASGYLIIYLFSNFIYSRGGKNIPLLDVALLTLGYLLRLGYGGVISETEISNWMFLTVLSAASYMGFGKRRNELLQFGTDSRISLSLYTNNFLNNSCQMFIILTIVFYSLTCADKTTFVAKHGANFIYTIPVMILICLRYNMILDSGNSDGDPVEIVLGDNLLILLILFYLGISFILLYNMGNLI